MLAGPGIQQRIPNYGCGRALSVFVQADPLNNETYTPKNYMRHTMFMQIQNKETCSDRNTALCNSLVRRSLLRRVDEPWFQQFISTLFFFFFLAD